MIAPIAKATGAGIVFPIKESAAKPIAAIVTEITDARVALDKFEKPIV